MKTRVAVIRVRGSIGVPKKIEDTMKIMRLYRKHTCVIISSTPNYTGMLRKIKDMVTWGEINEETLELLLRKRGRLAGKNQLTEVYLKDKVKMDFKEFSKAFTEFKKELKDVPGLKPFFKLKPPEKGFERKGIKQPFSLGGALGYRKDKINDLVRRMV